MPALSEKAMLVSLSISAWTARKLDRRVTAETNEAHNADKDAGRYDKLLVPSEAIKPVQRAASALRIFHRDRTLPWLDGGTRILPSKLYLDYSGQMRQLHEEFDEAVDEFLSDYEEIVESACDRLGDMYRPEDYPSVEEISSKFGATIDVFPVPTGGDFRVNVEGSEDIQAQIDARVEAAVDAAMKDIWERIYERVSHMAKKLREYRPATENDRAAGIFRDSLVENLREIVSLAPAWNLRESRELNEIIAQIEKDLCEHDADTLRDSEIQRHKTAEAADKILSTVSDYLA